MALLWCFYEAFKGLIEDKRGERTIFLISEKSLLSDDFLQMVSEKF